MVGTPLALAARDELVEQHLALGWISALPLIALLPHLRNLKQRLGAGTLYGALYYVAVNSLALPLYFGDTLPWLLGPATVALAVPLQHNIKRIRQLFWPVMITLTAGGVLSVALTLAIGWVLGAD